MADLSRYADIHSVLCHYTSRPHVHGPGCHSTCPTCGGRAYTPPEPPDVGTRADADRLS